MESDPILESAQGLASLRTRRSSGNDQDGHLVRMGGRPIVAGNETFKDSGGFGRVRPETDFAVWVGG